jgi:hypothetical protein
MFRSFNRFAPFKALRRFKIPGSRVQRKNKSIGTSKSQELTKSATGAVICTMKYYHGTATALD